MLGLYPRTKALGCGLQLFHTAPEAPRFWSVGQVVAHAMQNCAENAEGTSRFRSLLMLVLRRHEVWADHISTMPSQRLRNDVSDLQDMSATVVSVAGSVTPPSNMAYILGRRASPS
jgi:hypothetical protein